MTALACEHTYFYNVFDGRVGERTRKLSARAVCMCGGQSSVVIAAIHARSAASRRSVNLALSDEAECVLLLDMRDYLIEMCAYVYAAMYCEIKYVLLRIQVNYSGG